MTNPFFVLDDAPYGIEQAYNGLRVAGVLAHWPAETDKARVF